ncbi:protein-disulfide reductase DsbD domain-containing protein [Aliiroseovarius sp. F47248L]|uniref:protein-disulfide reductase DsbD family protein n=1 Tax=Aliiroseovarius sp. F47248L TaxID=2926420 RepID=UPI001FF6AE98|nr:protein-disulfide reductase DsbD domain-containing protein [Aliiroseovarius sp. F47248L]MCK0137925.1 thioredoxin family protein [Aliiroseovarius sp. F47248L]
MLEYVLEKFFRVFASRLILLICASAGLANVSNAAESESFSNTAVQARLIVAENGVGPNAMSLSAGLHLNLGEGWKAYWRSPGEVGTPPSIDWTGSENVAEVNLLWPAPQRFTAFGIENFGYHDDVVLPLRITLAEPGAPVHLNANVTLLTCSIVCVPQEFTLTLALPRASGVDAAAAALISSYVKKVPDDGAESGISIQSAYFDPDMTALTLAARSEQPFDSPDVFPELGAGTAFGKPDIRLGEGSHLLWARLPVLNVETDLPDLWLTVTDGERSASLFAELTDEAPKPPFTLDRVLPGVAELAWVAAIAFLGGLILNVMPCVLPVLSIKLSSTMKMRDQGRGRIRMGFAVSALGVLAFMWTLAALTIAARGLGMTVGWGLQFQNPLFLAVMFLILAVFSANLFGAFEISVPSSLQTRLARAGRGKGYTGDFATGAFAAVLATPCSAPFLGTAVAFALAGGALDITVIFTALGLGLAFPYLLVAAFPAAISHLPKPGRWMLWLKILLGLALVGTAGWLFWVLIGVGGVRSALAVLALSAILVTILSFNRLSTGIRLSGAAVMAALAIVSAGYLSEASTPNVTLATEWTAFDRGEIAKLVSRGEVVFVDVTADWCLTCKANKALVLDREPVLSAIRTSGVTAMQADWTRPDDSISRYLESFDRYGIPFNAVYGPGAPEGIVLPELLSSEAVLSAFEKAAERSVASGD